MSQPANKNSGDPVFFSRTEVIDILVDERRIQHENDLEDYEIALKSRTSDELVQMARGVTGDEIEIKE